MNTEEQIKKQGFSFVDKRGQNNPVQEKPVETVVEEAPVKERIWKSLAYVIVMNKHPNMGDLILGRAAGLANDGEVFTADWLFGMRWEAGFDWTVDAKRRLDSFLTCSCSSKTGHCQYHRRVSTNGGWLKEDMERLRSDGERAVPEVLEILSKAERAKASATRVLAPRR